MNGPGLGGPPMSASPGRGSDDEREAELAQGSEVHDRDALEAQVGLDRMLLEYLNDREVKQRPTAELVLYVVSHSESCDKARIALEKAIRCYQPGDVTVLVRDLATGPKTAEDHKIVIVPTVMLRHPRVVFLPGDLPDDASMLHDLLRSCGLRPTSSSRR